MNKAVLVIDMPENCMECRCYDDVFGTCRAKYKDFDKVEARSTRPIWCPLKRAPKEDEKEDFLEWSRGYQAGWNDCIDLILRGE